MSEVRPQTVAKILVYAVATCLLLPVVPFGFILGIPILFFLPRILRRRSKFERQWDRIISKAGL